MAGVVTQVVAKKLPLMPIKDNLAAIVFGNYLTSNTIHGLQVQ